MINSADAIDNANDIAEAYTASAIERARTLSPALRLKPKGHCYNCNDKLSLTGQIFCDTACGEEYEYFESRKRANRVAG